MNQTNTPNVHQLDAKALICVQLDIKLWSGRQALKREHLVQSNPLLASLPPQDLASMGSVRICDPEEVRKRLAIPPRQTASIHILSSLAHRRFRMRRAPLSTTSAMTVPITKSGYEDPVHATSAPATITPALAITSFAEKI